MSLLDENHEKVVVFLHQERTNIIETNGENR